MLGACMVMANRPGWEIITQLVALLAGAAQLAASAFAASSSALSPSTRPSPRCRTTRRCAPSTTSAPRARGGAHPDWSATTTRGWGVPSSSRRGGEHTGGHVSVLLRCFERVTVADPFDGAPLHGNPLNVVAGAPGWFVLVALLLTSGLVYGHGRWLAGRTRRIIAQSPSAGYGDRLGTDSDHLAAGQQRAAMGPGGGDSGL